MKKIKTILEIIKIMWRSRNDGFHLDRIAVLRDSGSLEWKLGLLKTWVEAAKFAPCGFVGFFSPGYDVEVPQAIRTTVGAERFNLIESRLADWQETPEKLESLINEKARRMADRYAKGQVETTHILGGNADWLPPDVGKVK